MSVCFPHGYRYPSFPFQCTVVFCRASSRSTVHSPGQGNPSLLISLGCSIGSGGVNACAVLPWTATIASPIRDPLPPPYSNEVVISEAVGQTIGQRALKIATRMQCPLGNT